MKNIDIYFVKRLETVKPIYQVLKSDRITEISTDNWTDEIRIKLLVQFVKNMDIPQIGGDSPYPEDVLGTLTLIKDTDQSVYSMNANVAILKINGYDLFLVERDDLSDGVLENNENYAVREMIINNIIYGSEIIGAYIGRAIDVDTDVNDCSSVDFLSFFNMSNDELDQNNLTSTWNSYQILKGKDQKNLIKDNKMNDFLNARGYQYILLISNS